MSEGAVLVKTRKFIKNPLLARRQMIIDIIHPGRAGVPRKELQEVIGGMYKAKSNLVILFGFKTKYGGGKTTGFCLIYDDADSMLKFEPKYRMVRNGTTEHKERSRKAMKEAKNKGKKIRGTGASIAKHKAKRAQSNE
mmetsp:Transcript_8970/g.13003  ORF Transcript_8970/g.13003 Transcript_8970/m.13003 type:complete len:138 (-) Transcript_8970:56-469(-)|eukprot:CAMPEP_0202441798 /NCGR_PEP_ID=MMETSP1360-20130828/1311_1 /ASSEMBLY_ACC=CAM_ASM_000848 /TAXON_ID=515479 /ORGANISM="Licmophora paradoxa, Strain CCMP2313" /LENGTH=137 /DNA_ID=CAMNT_0049056947 /DNA_START=116 /DNA_END=529 /DNA_ORIENTATION=-